MSASSETKHVKLWEVAGGRLLADWFVGSGPVQAAFAPDGRTLAVATDAAPSSTRLAAWTCGPSRPGSRKLSRPSPSPPMAGRSPPLRGSGDAALQEVAVWSLEERVGQRARRGIPCQVPFPAPRQPLAFHPRRPLVALDGGGTLAFWDAAGQPGPPPLAGVSARVIRFAPDGPLWAAVGNEVRAWELGEEKPRVAERPSGRPADRPGRHLLPGRGGEVGGGRRTQWPRLPAPCRSCHPGSVGGAQRGGRREPGPFRRRNPDRRRYRQGRTAPAARAVGRGDGRRAGPPRPRHGRRLRRTSPGQRLARPHRCACGTATEDGSIPC